MQARKLIVVAVAAAFPLSFAYAAGDKDKVSSEKSTPSAKADKNDGGAEAMFVAMDKDKDGFISKEEAKGTPHDKDFAKLDKNKDGKLSREEHAAAPEHAGKADKSADASSSSSSSSPSASTSSGPVTPSAGSSSTGGKSSKY
jgi:hypothetical protein